MKLKPELTRKSDRLGKEAIVPLLIKLSIPSIIGMAIQALYNVVDSVYLGHYDEKALAALSLIFPISMVMISVAIGTGVGSTSLISRLLGRGNNHKANNAAEHAALLALIYGLSVGIAGFFLSGGLIGFFTENKELIDLGTRYLRIILIGSVALFFPMVANNILRGEGNTFAPMVSMIIGAGLNILFDPFLIFGLGPFPRLGIEGAAYATVFSRVISGFFIAAILFSDRNELTLEPRDFSFDFGIVKEIYRVGFPAALMQLLASVMLAGMNKIVASYDTLALAVIGIYFRLQSFVFMPVFGLNQGYMPIVGYNYGHENPERVKKAIGSGMLVAFTFTTLGFLVFQFFPRELLLMFNDNPELIAIGKTAFQRITLAFPIVGPAVIGSATFQAFGKGFPSLTLSFLRQIIILLPLMYFMGKLGGLDFLWYSIPISDVISALLTGGWLWLTLKGLLSDKPIEGEVALADSEGR